jgi:acyl-CoA dehydrogenase
MTVLSSKRTPFIIIPLQISAVYGFSMSDLDTFRQETRTWLSNNCPASCQGDDNILPDILWGGRRQIIDEPDVQTWMDRLIEQGWTIPSWPKEYGGGGLSVDESKVLAEEMNAIGTYSPLYSFGISMLGPALLEYATEEQKREHLPKIASGEIRWCQGYSEPGSGSDLASLKLKATSDGDDLILNGSKIWTSHAHYANRMFLLVRTNDSGKPQDGITFLLLDMDSPGIKVEPILFASGTHEVNQVFFENVRVAKSNIVGEEHKGWSVAKYLLEFERGGGGTASRKIALKRLRNLAEQTPVDGSNLAADPEFARILDEVEVKLEAIQFTEFRIMAALSKGQNPGPESSIMKTLGADLGQYITELATQVIGYHAAVHQPEARTVGNNDLAIGPEAGLATFSQYFNLRASSIAGGSNEVQRNIMAKLVLGL